MKSIKTWVLALTLILGTAMVFSSCRKDDPQETTSKINYHFATIAEGEQLLAANTEYYNSLNQNNIDWRMRKTGSSINELIDFAQTCVRDFTDDEKAAITRAITSIETTLNDMGASLPFPEDIAFVKTTMQEESGAGAYTHKTEIYICAQVLQYGKWAMKPLSLTFMR